MTVVTMTTTGYGDAYPITHAGRLIMIVISIISLVVVSIFIVALNNFVLFSMEESRAYHTIRNNNINTKMRVRAANVIK
jgi:hypothetical protein